MDLCVDVQLATTTPQLSCTITSFSRLLMPLANSVLLSHNLSRIEQCIVHVFIAFGCGGKGSLKEVKGENGPP